MGSWQDEVTEARRLEEAERAELFELPEDDQRAQAGRYCVVTAEQWRDITTYKCPDTGRLVPFTPIDTQRAHYKAVLITETRTKTVPPVNYGDRWTDRLTTSGAKKLRDSADYLSKVSKGYRTFITLTLAPEWREMLARWDAGEHDADGYRGTLGAWVRELMNAMQQRARNGLILTNADTGAPEPLPRAKAPFEFEWVAECPKNEAGEDNPHVHVLMTWRVKPKHFRAWAAWIERLWGKGFARVEKIRKPQAAGTYILKAVGYAAKGRDGTQGRIRGNRYGISAKARAPGARLVAVVSAAWSALREAVRLGLEAGRDKWPPGVWFHAHGWGAAGREAWAKIMGALKADGWRMEPAPAGLFATRFRLAANAYLDRIAARLHPAWQYIPAIAEWQPGAVDLFDIDNPPMEAYA